MAYSRKHSNIIAVSCLAVAALLPLSSSAQTTPRALDSDYLERARKAAAQSSAPLTPLSAIVNASQETTGAKPVRKQKKSTEQLINEIKIKLGDKYGKDNPRIAKLEKIMLRLLQSQDPRSLKAEIEAELKAFGADVEGVDFEDLLAVRGAIKTDTEEVIGGSAGGTGTEFSNATSSAGLSAKSGKPSASGKTLLTDESFIKDFSSKSFADTDEDTMSAPSVNDSAGGNANPNLIQDASVRSGDGSANTNYSPGNFDPTGGRGYGSDSSTSGSSAPSVRGAGQNLVQGTGNGQPSGATAQGAGSAADGHSGENTTPTANNATSSVSARPLASTTSSTSKPAASSYKPSADDLSPAGVESAKRTYQTMRSALDSLTKEGKSDSPLAKKTSQYLQHAEAILKQGNISEAQYKTKTQGCNRVCSEIDNRVPAIGSPEFKQRASVLLDEMAQKGEVISGLQNNSASLDNLLKHVGFTISGSNILGKVDETKIPPELARLKYVYTNKNIATCRSGSFTAETSDRQVAVLCAYLKYQATKFILNPGCPPEKNSPDPIFCKGNAEILGKLTKDLKKTGNLCASEASLPNPSVTDKVWASISRTDGFLEDDQLVDSNSRVLRVFQKAKNISLAVPKTELLFDKADKQNIEDLGLTKSTNRLFGQVSLNEITATASKKISFCEKLNGAIRYMTQNKLDPAYSVQGKAHNGDDSSHESLSDGTH